MTLEQLAKLLAISGLILLGLGGIFLALGRDPDAYVLNYQAEALANLAFLWLVISLGLRLTSRKGYKGRV